MNKIIQISAIILCTLSLKAQTDVYFKIDHFLGSNTFAFNSAASNNMSNAFNVSRLQYYISEIKIVHDSGQVTSVANKWILVDANNPVDELLGSFNITSVEAIEFGIGVEQASNHLDPSSYAMSHPLAPKSPSMHWGWTAGYRFVAMEGKTGSSLNQTYEFHALGDKNYQTVTVATNGFDSGADLVIGINADYEKALHDIDLSTGNNLVHGENGKAALVLANFGSLVFTENDGSNSVSLTEKETVDFDLYPNPSTSKVYLEGLEIGTEIFTYDSFGRLIFQQTVSAANETLLQFTKAGVYQVKIVDLNGTSALERIVITK